MLVCKFLILGNLGSLVHFRHLLLSPPYQKIPLNYWSIGAMGLSTAANNPLSLLGGEGWGEGGSFDFLVILKLKYESGQPVQAALTF